MLGEMLGENARGMLGNAGECWVNAGGFWEMLGNAGGMLGNTAGMLRMLGIAGDCWGMHVNRSARSQK